MIEEAQFGLADMAAHQNVKAGAAALGPESWMLGCTKDQIDKLQELLEHKR